VVSAWAKRAVMLWSILPPLALMLAERWFAGTHVIARELGERLIGLGPLAFHTNPAEGSWITTVVDHDTIRTPANLWIFLDPVGFFSQPQVWVGVAVGAALVVGAIQLRMRRAEI
jgi:hypothetical protein